MSERTNHPFDLAPTVLNSTIPSYQAEPGEAYMNFRQKAYLKQLLEQERAYWVEAERRMITEFLKKKNVRLSSDPVDIANREVEMRSAVRGREHRLIKKIDEALAQLRAEGNQYGFCNHCRTEIGMKRLEIRPTANLCFDCKTREEVRE